MIPTSVLEVDTPDEMDDATSPAGDPFSLTTILYGCEKPGRGTAWACVLFGVALPELAYRWRGGCSHEGGDFSTAASNRSGESSPQDMHTEYGFTL